MLLREPLAIALVLYTTSLLGAVHAGAPTPTGKVQPEVTATNDDSVLGGGDDDGGDDNSRLEWAIIGSVLGMAAVVVVIFLIVVYKKQTKPVNEYVFASGGKARKGDAARGTGGVNFVFNSRKGEVKKSSAGALSTVDFQAVPQRQADASDNLTSLYDDSDHDEDNIDSVLGGGGPPRGATGRPADHADGHAPAGGHGHGDEVLVKNNKATRANSQSTLNPLYQGTSI